MSQEHSLSDFCRAHTQKKAAEIIGCCQGNISLILKTGREVFIIEDGKGRFSSYEIRRPKKSKRKQTA